MPATPSLRRVLIVEDDPILRGLYQSMFEPERLSVEFSVDGLDALTKIEAWRPDVIVLDLAIPFVAGWELLARIRATAGCPPVVVAAALADPARAAQMGAAACFVKPFRLTSLRDTVFELLAASPSDRARSQALDAQAVATAWP